MTQLYMHRYAALFVSGLAAISGISAQTPTNPPPRRVEFPAGYQPMGAERTQDTMLDAISVREDVWEYLCVYATYNYESSITEHLKFTQTVRDTANAHRNSATRARSLGQSEDAARYDAMASESERQAEQIDLQFLARPRSSTDEVAGTAGRQLPGGLLCGVLAYVDMQQPDTLQMQVQSTKSNIIDLLAGGFFIRTAQGQSTAACKLKPNRQSEAEAMVRQMGMALDLLKSGDKQGAQSVLDRSWASIIETAKGPASSSPPPNALVPQSPEQIAQFQVESKALEESIKAQLASGDSPELHRLLTRRAFLDGVVWIAKEHSQYTAQLEAGLKNPSMDPRRRMEAQAALEDWNMARTGNRRAIKKLFKQLFSESNFPMLAFFADVQSRLALHRVQDSLNQSHSRLQRMQAAAKTQNQKEEYQEALEAIDSILRMMRDNQLAEAQVALDAKWAWVLGKQGRPQDTTRDKKEPATAKAFMDITQEWVDMYMDGRVSNRILDTLRFGAFKALVWQSTMDNRPKPAKVAIDTIRSNAFQYCPDNPFLAFLMDAGIPEFQERMARCIQVTRKQVESLQDRSQAQSLAPYIDCMAESLALAQAGNHKGAQDLLDKQWQAVLDVTKFVYIPSKEEDRRITIRNPAWLDRSYQKGLSDRLQQLLESKGAAWEAAKIGSKFSYIRILERDARSKANQIKSIDTRIQRLLTEKQAGFDVADQLASANREREDLARGTPIRDLLALSCFMGPGRLKNSDTQLTSKKAEMIAPTWMFFPVRHDNLASSIQRQLDEAGANPPADIRPILDRHRKLLSLLQQGDLTGAQATLDQLIEEVLAVER